MDVIFLSLSLFLILINPSLSSLNKTKFLLDIRTEYRKYVHVTPIRDDELLCRCNDINCDFDITEVFDTSVIPGYSDEMRVCLARKGGVCRKMIRKNLTDTEVFFSCIRHQELMPPENPFICQNATNPTYNQIVYCCSSHSLCNDDESYEVEEPPFKWYWYIFFVFFIIIFLSAIGLILGIFCQESDRVKKFFNCFVSPFFALIDRIWTRRNRASRSKGTLDWRLEKLIDDMESPSTVMGRILFQRTISHQVTLKKPVGFGRFGQVYLGDWRGEQVAVKICETRNFESWHRETTIYETNRFRHKSLLRWIGSDNKDNGSVMCYWMVFEYIPLGSLSHFLEHNEISLPTAVNFVYSIASGLDYLHNEVSGLQNYSQKHAIAHCDLKAGNILIRNDMTCAIADLGMAVRLFNGKIDLPRIPALGTVRYLPPEFLTNTFLFNNFNSYVQKDIYAFSLVIWEICRRIKDPDHGINECFPYFVPYYEFVVREPMPEEMRICVVVNNYRPTIQGVWLQNPMTEEFVRISKECWTANPNSRLTALNICYAIERLANENGLEIHKD